MPKAWITFTKGEAQRWFKEHGLRGKQIDEAVDWMEVEILMHYEAKLNDALAEIKRGGNEVL